MPKHMMHIDNYHMGPAMWRAHYAGSEPIDHHDLPFLEGPFYKELTWHHRGARILCAISTLCGIGVGVGLMIFALTGVDNATSIIITSATTGAGCVAGCVGCCTWALCLRGKKEKIKADYLEELYRLADEEVDKRIEALQRFKESPSSHQTINQQLGGGTTPHVTISLGDAAISIPADDPDRIAGLLRSLGTGTGSGSSSSSSKSAENERSPLLKIQVD